MQRPPFLQRVFPWNPQRRCNQLRGCFAVFRCGAVMIAGALIAQSAVYHDEIWKLSSRGNLTCRGQTNQKITTAREKLLRDKNSKGSAHCASNDPYGL